MSVVDLSRVREKREAEAWQRYCHARNEAERTCDIEWGRAAGLAWRDWLDSFQTPEQHEREREFRRVMKFPEVRRPKGRA